jgi:hypothetical protein
VVSLAFFFFESEVMDEKPPLWLFENLGEKIAGAIEMLKVNHRYMGCIAGIVWLVVGSLLLRKGIFLISTAAMEGADPSSPYPLFHGLMVLVGDSAKVVLALLSVAILIGYAKGRLILMRAGERIISRIASLRAPISIFRLYGRRDCLMMLSMMGLGMVMRFLEVPIEIRGFILVAVGTALIQGSLAIFEGTRLFISQATPSDNKVARNP